MSGPMRLRGLHGRQLAAATAALACVVALALLATGSFSASNASPGRAAAPHGRPAATRPSRRVQLPPPNSIYWGATIKSSLGQAPYNMDVATSFERDAGKAVSVIDWGGPWYSTRYCNGYCPFPTDAFQAVRDHGSIPFFTWAPYPGNGAFTDREIAAGTQDSFVTDWAKAAKAWGHPLFLRFAWEMNGSWFPWGVGDRGTTVAQWLAMYKHVHDIFTRVGATNVSWVWCPNVDAPFTYEPLRALYPGPAYVDWTCIDGYNGNAPYISFSDLYRPTYEAITGTIAPDKPLILGEVGSTESGGSKAQWIQNMFRALPTVFPRIRGFMWQNTNDPGPNSKTDWPIESSPSAQAAFAAGVSSPIYTSNMFGGLNTSPIPTAR